MHGNFLVFDRLSAIVPKAKELILVIQSKTILTFSKINQLEQHTVLF